MITDPVRSTRSSALVVCACHGGALPVARPSGSLPVTLERVVSGWQFDDHTFARSANAFENPDFVAVVISCYRHSFGLETGEAAFQELEAQLAQKPRITVPTITIDGTNDPLKPGGTLDHATMFADLHDHRVVDSGHSVPQEQPSAFADAVIRIH